MSDQENFLSRWARRKRDVADAEAGAAQPEAAKASVAPDAEPPEAGLEPDESLFDLKSLPPIEAITAETDIRAFLAPGVPAEIKMAALRRAWSADPAIRDFIGLSENSWDFNDPTAMGGFGPLEMTDDLRRMVAQLFSPASDEPENPLPGSPVETAENAETPASRQDENAARIEQSSKRDQLSQGATNVVAVQQQPNEQPARDCTARRCHGGALPK